MSDKDKDKKIHDTDEANKPDEGVVTTADETDPTGGIPQGSGGGPEGDPPPHGGGN